MCVFILINVPGAAENSLFRIAGILIAVISLGAGGTAGTAADHTTNRPPQVSIVYPHPYETFSIGAMLIKIKAEAFDPDGSIAQVQFFADGKQIGVATNPPYNILWVIEARQATLRVVAIDNEGRSAESRPVLVGGDLGPQMPVVEITAPPNKFVMSAPATFGFAAEVLASVGDAGPVEFLINGQSIGTVSGEGTLRAATPPVSLSVTNLAEGEHQLAVRYHGQSGGYCQCLYQSNLLRVVKLGIRAPGLCADGHFQFEVVTSFPGLETIVQGSSDLQSWMAIRTNQPATNTFVFTEASPATNAPRFYRVVLPAQQP
jgi:hypothetical protein